MILDRVEVAAAVNDDAILKLCLARSPELAGGRVPLRLYEGFSSAGAAYNQALEEASADYVVFAHQDVYLPDGALFKLTNLMDALCLSEPDWALAGVIGIDPKGQIVGETWSTGLEGLVGRAIAAPVEVLALDELLLVVRRSANLKFDSALPGFHLYAADIIQIAKAQGRKAFVVPLGVIHHDRTVIGLDRHYRQAYRYLQKKWREILPIPNLICPIVSHPWMIIWRDLQIRRNRRFARARVAPQGDPAQIARQLSTQAALGFNNGSAP
jgi:glycosyltransferase involved in cell wall biosynthesis